MSKIILCVFLSWAWVTRVTASEELLSFFSKYSLGSSFPKMEGEIVELGEVNIFGVNFSSYCMLSGSRAIEGAGIYLRAVEISKQTDLADQVERSFTQIRDLLERKYGNADVVEVPNFDHIRGQVHTMLAWKDEDSVLILNKIAGDDRSEVDVRHLQIEYYLSLLGSDHKKFFLGILAENTGILSQAFGVPDESDERSNPREVISESPPLGQQTELESEPSRKEERDQARVVEQKVVQNGDAVKGENLRIKVWAYTLILLLVVSAGIAIFRVSRRRTLR